MNSLDHPGGTEPNFAPDAAKFIGASRRHLAIVDQSPLRRECLKLALAYQPRRWRVTDVAEAADLAAVLPLFSLRGSENPVDTNSAALRCSVV